MQGIANFLFAQVGMPGSVTSSGLNDQKAAKETTMLLLVIAMGAPLFAVIGYALLNPNQRLPAGANHDAANDTAWH